MFKSLVRSKFSLFIFLYYAILLVWWLKLFISGQQTGQENYLFGAAYPILALIGGVNGLFISKVYGGWSSIMGRGMIFLSLALLGQVFGQFIWTYYNIIVKVEVPYPSFADIGYFAVIPFNCLAMLSFTKATGAKFKFRTISSSVQIVLVPAIMVTIAYFLFLNGNKYDFTNPIKSFLDFGYPFGEAIYISLAILTYLLSKKLLGGIMRSKILFLIFAFIVQFVTDYTFLYMVSRNIYYNGGIADLMYATSFAIYSLALLNLKFIDTKD